MAVDAFNTTKVDRIETFECEDRGQDVVIYEWFWLVEDINSFKDFRREQDYICVYGQDKIPLCPLHLCNDEECQQCFGFLKPSSLEVNTDSFNA